MLASLPPLASLALWLSSASADSTAFVRVNQLGYLPDAPKVAVVCSLRPARLTQFVVEDTTGARVLGPRTAERQGAYAGCAETYRLDFTGLRRTGRYRVRAGDFVSPTVRIAPDVYDGLADTLLGYLRQQRSGYNPFLRDSAHTKDGIVVDHPTRTGDTIRVSGGWADAADYLQYVATSATATYHLLAAYRDAPRAFDDHYDARGLAGANGVSDALDEARHGLAWLVRMFPDDSTLFNQLGDDRDHTYWDLITTDSSDYGWGKCAAAGLSLHRQAAGDPRPPEPVDRVRVDGGENGGGVRARRASDRTDGSGSCRHAPAQGRRRLRPRREIPGRVPDRAGCVSILLRRG